MGTGEFNAGGNPVMDWVSIPEGGGGRNTPSRRMPQKPEISADLMDYLARMQTSPFLPLSQFFSSTFTKTAKLLE